MPTTANSGLTLPKLKQADNLTRNRSLRAKIGWVRRKNKGRMTATEIDLGNKLRLLA